MFLGSKNSSIWMAMPVCGLFHRIDCRCSQACITGVQVPFDCWAFESDAMQKVPCKHGRLWYVRLKDDPTNVFKQAQPTWLALDLCSQDYRGSGVSVTKIQICDSHFGAYRQTHFSRYFTTVNVIAMVVYKQNHGLAASQMLQQIDSCRQTHAAAIAVFPQNMVSQQKPKANLS